MFLHVFVSSYKCFLYCAFKSLQDSQDSQTVQPTTAIAASAICVGSSGKLDVLLQGPEKKANSTVVKEKPKPKAKAKSNSKKKQPENSKKSKKVTQGKAEPGSKNCKASKGEVWGKGWKEVIQCFACSLEKYPQGCTEEILKMDAGDAVFVHFVPDHVGSREVGGCETPSHHI